MNPTVYQVEHKGKIVTVKSNNDAVGVVRGLFNVPRKGIHWEVIKRNRLNKPIITIVNKEYTVTDMENTIDPRLVKWCPALTD